MWSAMLDFPASGMETTSTAPDRHRAIEGRAVEVFDVDLGTAAMAVSVGRSGKGSPG